MLLICLASASAFETIYNVDLIFNKLDSSVELYAMNVFPWTATTPGSEDCTGIEEDYYTIRLESLDGRVLYKLCMKPLFTILSDPPEELNETLIDLYLPYNPEAKYLKIYQGDIEGLNKGQLKQREKLVVELKNNLCNNDGRCNNYETYYSCNDCNICSKDGICTSGSGDGCCDPDCIIDDDCEGITNDHDNDWILDEDDLCLNTNPNAAVITEDGCSCEQIKEALAAQGKGYAEGVLSDKNLGICRAAQAGAKGVLSKTGRAFGLGYSTTAGVFGIIAVIALLIISYCLIKKGKKWQ